MKKEIMHSLKWVLFWIGLALLFNVGVWIFMGQEKALQFLGGYLIELSLSMDNLFVFLSIFMAYGITEHAQHRVLNWGICGAIVLRLIFILLGVAVIDKFHFVLYFFGALLIFNGLKMFKKEEPKDISQSKIMKLVHRFIPMTTQMHGDRFMVKVPSEKHPGQLVRRATPLLGIVILIECTDIIFAIDSVPAIFSVSTDVFIVYTSNIFAIVCLRQLFYVLEHLQERFAYVRYGVAVILTFTGVKLLVLIFNLHISIVASIAFIFGVLTLSIVFSIIYSGRKQKNSQAKLEEYPTKDGQVNQASAEK